MVLLTLATLHAVCCLLPCRSLFGKKKNAQTPKAKDRNASRGREGSAKQVYMNKSRYLPGKAVCMCMYMCLCGCVCVKCVGCECVQKCGGCECVCVSVEVMSVFGSVEAVNV